MSTMRDLSTGQSWSWPDNTRMPDDALESVMGAVGGNLVRVLAREARRARAAEAALQEEYSHQALLVTALREEMEQQEGELLRLRAVERTAEAFTAVWFGNKAVADEWAAYLAACTAYREWQKQEVEK